MAFPGLSALVVALAAAAAFGSDQVDGVVVIQTPEGGIQPQAAVGPDGTAHLIFFKGDPAAGDLYYTHRTPGSSTFAKAIRVNGRAGSAIAIGTIRGGRIAVGKDGVVHVGWNGSNPAEPKNPFGGTPFLYARLAPGAAAFEPERNLMKRSSALDGGGAVAADLEGNVYAVWHGQAEGASGESERRIWVARSTDSGATWADEQPAWSRPTGACGCCGVQARVGPSGGLHVLYRAATRETERGMYMIRSHDHAARFDGLELDPWPTSSCPMSSAALTDHGKTLVAAWETKGQIRFRRFEEGSNDDASIHSPPGNPGNRKHPALAADSHGTLTLAWTEGTGWQKGGTLVWQRFDQGGKAKGPAHRVDRGIPVWGLPTVVSLANDRVLVIH